LLEAAHVEDHSYVAEAAYACLRGTGPYGTEAAGPLTIAHATFVAFSQAIIPDGRR
jgi:hypothetical protein